MKLTVLENGNVRIGFREQIEVKPEDVKEELRKLNESIRQRLATMLEVYESDYFKSLSLPTIAVSEIGVTTSATFPKKAGKADDVKAKAVDSKPTGA